MTYYGAKQLAESFRTVRNNTIQVAQDIPEDKYQFKAADDTRTVEKLFVHIALTSRFQYSFHSENRTSMDGINFATYFQEVAAEEAKPRTKAQVIDLLKTEGEKWAGFVEGIAEQALSDTIT